MQGSLIGVNGPRVKLVLAADENGDGTECEHLRRGAAKGALRATLGARDMYKTILMHCNDKRRIRNLLLPAVELAEKRRHGVRCEGTDQIKPHVNVGETLLACARDMAANLLVIGCYGHARLREFVFGGASRHVLQHMSIPVLMSH
jgi:nucleotide-binding universal stress UspA family protein